MRRRAPHRRVPRPLSPHHLRPHHLRPRGPGPWLVAPVAAAVVLAVLGGATLVRPPAGSAPTVDAVAGVGPDRRPAPPPPWASDPASVWSPGRGVGLFDRSGTGRASRSLDRPAPPVAAPPSRTTPPRPAVRPSTPPVPSAAAPAATTARAGNLLGQRAPYVDPTSLTAQVAASGTGAERQAAAVLAAVPQARWVAPTDGLSHIAAYVRGADAAGRLAVLAVYGIPDRDCGGYSAGGATSASAYLTWVRSLRSVVAGHPTVVVLEPDALAGGGCQDGSAAEATLLDTLGNAVDVLAQDATTAVYLDAGHEDWLSPATLARRLSAAHVARARGFSLDVANSYATASEVSYGRQVVAALGGAGHFVLDTSRNGAGPPPDLAWCNPPGLLAGARPGPVSGTAGLDGYLWVKHPGESDGTCNGGPSSGQWFGAWAVDFVRRSQAAGKL